LEKANSLSCSIVIALLVWAVSIPLFGAAAAGQTTKVRLKVATDGLPSGHGTPEGAACDLARSFINRDATLFSATSIRNQALRGRQWTGGIREIPSRICPKHEGGSGQRRAVATGT
jgi:hypothetical protein